MKQRKRIYYSAAQRAAIWDRWKAGESMSSIGRRFDRESSSVFSVLSPTGGIRPPDRKRTARALSLGEREEISRGLAPTQATAEPICPTLFCLDCCADAMIAACGEARLQPSDSAKRLLKLINRLSLIGRGPGTLGRHPNCPSK